MRTLLAAGLALLPALAAAQSAPAAKAASGPLASYRAFKDEPVAPWRAVNDQVGRIGGWKVYARENLQSPAPAAPSAPPHAGHGATGAGK